MICVKVTLVAAVPRGLDLLNCADANAHHTHWGSTDANERGEYLLNFILHCCLLICNKGNERTFVTRTRSEALDITLISESDE